MSSKPNEIIDLTDKSDTEHNEIPEFEQLPEEECRNTQIAYKKEAAKKSLRSRLKKEEDKENCMFGKRVITFNEIVDELSPRHGKTPEGQKITLKEDAKKEMRLRRYSAPSKTENKESNSTTEEIMKLVIFLTKLFQNKKIDKLAKKIDKLFERDDEKRDDEKRDDEKKNPRIGTAYVLWRSYYLQINKNNPEKMKMEELNNCWNNTIDKTLKQLWEQEYINKKFK